MKKLLSLVTALAVLASLCAGSALAAEDLGGGLGTELQDAGVDVSGSAPDETADVQPAEKETVVIEASGPVDSVSITEGQELRGPGGELVTMTVDGVPTTVVPGAYSGEIVLSLS